MKENSKTNEGKWLGWWVITTPNGKEYATERYEGDSLLKTIVDAIVTFGSDIKIAMK